MRSPIPRENRPARPAPSPPGRRSSRRLLAFSEEEGAARFTTNHVAARAGVSIGSLYQYFPDKQAVLTALLVREREVLLAAVRAIAQQDASPRARLSALIGAALDHQFARPRLALQLEYLETGLDVQADAARLHTDLAADVLLVLKAHAPGATLATARDCVAICQALANAAALNGETDLDALRTRLGRAVFGYLGD